MAKTGKSYMNITPGVLPGEMPAVETILEASSQTGLRGAPCLVTSGYINQCSANPTAIYGFLAQASGNGASDGAKTSQIYRITPNRRFVGTLKATLTQAMIGSSAALVNSSGTWYLDTSTSISSNSQVIVVRPVLGFAIGDTNPEVEFIVLASKIQFP